MFSIEVISSGAAFLYVASWPIIALVWSVLVVLLVFAQKYLDNKEIKIEFRNRFKAIVNREEGWLRSIFSGSFLDFSVNLNARGLVQVLAGPVLILTLAVSLVKLILPEGSGAICRHSNDCALVADVGLLNAFDENWSETDSQLLSIWHLYELETRQCSRASFDTFPVTLKRETTLRFGHIADASGRVATNSVVLDRDSRVLIVGCEMLRSGIVVTPPRLISFVVHDIVLSEDWIMR